MNEEKHAFEIMKMDSNVKLLEDKLYQLMDDFESATGMVVTSIDIQDVPNRIRKVDISIKRPNIWS